MADPEPDQESIEEKILAQLASDAEDKAVSWVLSKVGLGGDPSDMTEQLQKLFEAIAAVQATLNNFIRIYTTTVAFDQLCDTAINKPALWIEERYDDLRRLEKGEAAKAQILGSVDAELKYADALDGFDRAFQGNVVGAPGELLELAVDMILARITGPGYNPFDVTTLFDAYQNFESFFHGLVNVQIKAGTLQTNAANLQRDRASAQTAAQLLNDNLANHARRFLTAVERLTTTYCPDGSFLNAIADPATDPIFNAQKIVQIIPEAKGTRVYMWNGTGNGYNLNPGDADFPATYNLSSETGGPAAMATQEWRADNPRPLGRDGDFWTVARYCFPPSTPPGPYFPADPPNLWPVNLIVRSAEPSAPRNSPFTSATWVGIGTDASGNPMHSDVWIPLSSLWISNGWGEHGQFRNVAADSFTIEAWVWAKAPGAIFSGAEGNWLLASMPDGTATLQSYNALQNPPFNVDQTINTGSDQWYWVNQWHHVAMVCDYGSSQTNIYFDGQPVSSLSNVYTMDSFQLGAFAMASPVAGGDPIVSLPISCYYNEVRVWLRARGAGEIQADLHRMLWSGNSLACVYGFDQGNGNDRTGQRAALDMSGSSSFLFQRTYSGGWM